MNTAILKTPSFWVASAVALLGVLLSQHVIADGSTLAGAAGWVMTFIGSIVAGHEIGVSKVLA